MKNKQAKITLRKEMLFHLNAPALYIVKGKGVTPSFPTGLTCTRCMSAGLQCQKLPKL